MRRFRSSERGTTFALSSWFTLALAMAGAALADEPGMRQLLQVKGEGRGRQAKLVGNGAGREPVGTALDQHTEDAEPRLVRQSAERRDGLFCFHDWSGPLFR